MAAQYNALRLLFQQQNDLTPVNVKPHHRICALESATITSTIAVIDSATRLLFTQLIDCHPAPGYTSQRYGNAYG
jgi:hypothetical protein